MRVSIDFSLALMMHQRYLFWISQMMNQHGIEFYCFSGLPPGPTKRILRERRILQLFDDLLYGNPTAKFINDPQLVSIDRLLKFKKSSYTKDGINPQAYKGK